MSSFCAASKKILSEAHPQLRTLLNRVVDEFDMTLIYSKRDKETQNELYDKGRSKLKYPHSAHNAEPWSLAVDVVPYPQLWKASHVEFAQMREQIFYAACALGITLKPLIKFKDGSGDWAHIELSKEDLI